MATSIEAAKVLADVADKLFGRVGAAVLLGAVAFFLLPGWTLNFVGLEPRDPGQRTIAGFCLLISAATCLVSIAIRASGPYQRCREWLSARWLYWRLSPEAKILLGLQAQVELPKIFVPKHYEPGHELIDIGLMYSSDASGSTLTLKPYPKGDRFVRRFRKKLRAFALKNDELSRKVAEVMTEAQKQPRASWMSY